MKKLIVLMLVLLAVVVANADSLTNHTASVKIDSTTNTIKLDQSTAGANGVDTDVMGTGLVGSATKDVGIVTAVSIGTLTTGTTRFGVTAVDGGIWIGDAGVAAGKGVFLATDSTQWFNTSTVTPTMYFLHTVATKTVHISHIK